MLVLDQHLFEEGTGCCQDHLMGLHLVTILTGQSHISKVKVLPQIPKGFVNIGIKVIPLEAKLLWHVKMD